ncbi:hypothetical protein BLNAU_19250 [Blattamonas nauphoetae]|uniref:Calponin-homology (CH) domain-containing protein n=1 Tax=Blattamonas nauphoetae TaxID=2049346 RepID=A0ABQ9X2B0_9EUKA|nr:hypothetical protein BLNAU_19250 [Blattamonas nauphoetae]
MPHCSNFAQVLSMDSTISRQRAVDLLHLQHYVLQTIESVTHQSLKGNLVDMICQGLIFDFFAVIYPAELVQYNTQATSKYQFIDNLRIFNQFCIEHFGFNEIDVLNPVAVAEGEASAVIKVFILMSRILKYLQQKGRIEEIEPSEEIQYVDEDVTKMQTLVEDLSDGADAVFDDPTLQKFATLSKGMKRPDFGLEFGEEQNVDTIEQDPEPQSTQEEDQVQEVPEHQESVEQADSDSAPQGDENEDTEQFGDYQQMESTGGVDIVIMDEEQLEEEEKEEDTAEEADASEQVPTDETPTQRYLRQHSELLQQKRLAAERLLQETIQSADEKYARFLEERKQTIEKQKQENLREEQEFLELKQSQTPWVSACELSSFDKNMQPSTEQMKSAMIRMKAKEIKAQTSIRS